MGVVKRVGLLLLLMLLMLLAVVAYFMMTHGGLVRITSLGQSYLNGELTFADSSGALVGPASVSQLAYADESGLSVDVDNIRFDWHPRRLLRRTLQVDELVMDGIVVRLPPPSTEKKPDQPFALRDFALPLKADVQNILITDLQVFPHGAAEPFVLDEIRLDATGRQSELKLVELAVNGPTFTFDMDGTLETQGDWPVELNPRWTFKHSTAGTITGSGSLTGDTEALTVKHNVSGAGTLDIDAVISDVMGDISWQGELLANIDNLGTVAAGAESVPLNIEAQTTGSLAAYSADGVVKSGHPSVGDTRTQFSVRGDTSALTITESVTTIADASVRLSVDGSTQFDNLQSDLNISWTDLQWPLRATDGPAVVITPTGRIELTGTPDDLLATGFAALSSPQAGKLDLNFNTAVTPELLTINALRIAPAESDNAALNVTGNVNLKSQVAAIDGTMNELTWPPGADPDAAMMQVASGTFSLQGPFDDYRLELEAALNGKDIPAGEWRVAGNGNQGGLAPLTITGSTLGGNISGAGEVVWQPAPAWQFSLDGNGIDPSRQWPGAQGDINLQLTTEGQVTDNGLAVENRLVGLSGSYRQQPLSGGGVVLIEGQNITIDDLSVQAGEAILKANGSVSDKLDIEWDVDLPNLKKLVPDVAGTVKLSGKVSGPRDAPASNFSLTGRELVAGGVSVGTLSGSGDVDISGAQRSSVKLSLTDVVSGGQVFDAISVDGSGTPAQHNATLNIESELVQADMTLDGAVEAGMWKGSIDALDINNPDAGQWALKAPVVIEAGASRVVAESLCLQSDPATVCVDGNWDAANGVQAQVDVDALDTGRFKSFMPPELMVDALVSGEAELTAAPGSTPVVVADITIPGGTMDYLDGGEPKSTTLGASRIQLDLRDDNLKSKVDLDFGEQIGTVNADTQIGALSGARNLAGAVKTDLKDISPFSAFAPGLDSFDGALNTNMKLAGTIDQPRVAGNSELDALVLEVPSVAMKLIDGKIIAKSDGKGGLLLSGTAQSGDGVIELDGTYDPAGRKLNATIKGENFRVANAQRQRAEVSPDINIKMDGDDIKVSGLLHIPSAFVDTGGSSGLIKESPDVVIVNDESADKDAAERRITVDVRVTLGDDIRVKAGQFSGALAGELAVEQAPDGVPTGVGAIEVVSGDFVVYGQTLTMERGRILFGGGPVTNPALEFEVAREVPPPYDVKAGALITGTAQAPILQLQSEPAQTDANTLSYILLGRPVDNAGVSYTLGKYLTPDIYVSYERDLFTQAQTFSVRYRINDRLTLLASSTEDVSGSDLVYTFER